MTYNDLADMIDSMTSEQKEADVKVKIEKVEDLVSAKDFRIAEQAVNSTDVPTVFIQI
jgi:hypothetical protein